jgi:hypothetical protein
MPKVNNTQLPDRIKKRIAELEAGLEVDAKHIRAVLTPAQQEQLAAAWAEQQTLRKGKRAVTPEQQQALGWKTIRQVRLEILRLALAEAESNLTDAFADELRRAEIRQARIYMDTLGAAIDEGRNAVQARNQANNALTRSHLRRLDGQTVGNLGLTKRDMEIRQLEDAIKRRAESEMTAEEREQAEILAEHEKALNEKQRKSRG